MAGGLGTPDGESYWIDGLSPYVIPTESGWGDDVTKTRGPPERFLKTENNEDYIVFIKTQLDDLFSNTDSDIDKLPFCEDMLAVDV